MATKEYDSSNPVTMASEPGVDYVSGNVLPGCVSFEQFKEALMKSVVLSYTRRICGG